MKKKSSAHWNPSDVPFTDWESLLTCLSDTGQEISSSTLKTRTPTTVEMTGGRKRKGSFLGIGGDKLEKRGRRMRQSRW